MDKLKPYTVIHIITNRTPYIFFDFYIHKYVLTLSLTLPQTIVETYLYILQFICIRAYFTWYYIGGCGVECPRRPKVGLERIMAREWPLYYIVEFIHNIHRYVWYRPLLSRNFSDYASKFSNGRFSSNNNYYNPLIFPAQWFVRFDGILVFSNNRNATRIYCY